MWKVSLQLIINMKMVKQHTPTIIYHHLHLERNLFSSSKDSEQHIHKCYLVRDFVDAIHDQFVFAVYLYENTS